MKPQDVDKLICGWSMLTGHQFSEQDLNSLVDLIALKTAEEFQGLEVAIVELGNEATKAKRLVSALTEALRDARGDFQRIADGGVPMGALANVNERFMVQMEIAMKRIERIDAALEQSGGKKE